ncbi:hypothetical protein PFISCL1PPCAC_23063, partial [Pristionchus fissidentatus]
ISSGRGEMGNSVGGVSVVISPGGVGEVGAVGCTITDPVVDLLHDRRIGDPREGGNDVIGGNDEIVLVLECISQGGHLTVLGRVTE